MKAIKMNIINQFCQYRIPRFWKQTKTYLLPTYSSIIGMVHSACGMYEYEQMTISIQGNIPNVTNEIETIYEFKPGAKWEEARHNVQVSDYGMCKGIRRSDILYESNLVIHIIMENTDEIAEKLFYPKNYMSLGRHEDLININDIKIVNIENSKTFDNVEDAFYIPESMFVCNNKNIHESTSGTILYLNEKYNIDKTNKSRNFNKIKCLYSTNKLIINEFENKYVDEEGMVVFI